MFVELNKIMKNSSKKIKDLSIICWNVNGIRAWYKKGCLDWVLKESPEIFCLQETKAHPDQLTDDLRNPNGYFSYFDHSKLRKGYSGVAVYSKIKADKVEYSLGDKEEYDLEGRFLALFFNDTKLVFINCYFPNGGGGPHRLEYKLGFYDAFLKYINKKRKAGWKIVFCGDVNTAHNEIDLARPKENEKNTGFLPIERAWVNKVVDNDYVDTFRYLNPEKISYSWWDMKTMARERNVGWRIDYFFVSSDLINKIQKADILRDIYGSDHCPIYLKLDL